MTYTGISKEKDWVFDQDLTGTPLADAMRLLWLSSDVLTLIYSHSNARNAPNAVNMAHDL